MADVPELHDLDDLARLVGSRRALYVRYSSGPDADRDDTSMDYESGLPLPGLSVHPLDPAAWWTRPVDEWLARQLCSYDHLAEEGDRYAWVLTGRVVDRGPDNEPLLQDWEPVARLGDDLVHRARRLYADRFEVGRDSRGGDDGDDEEG